MRLGELAERLGAELMGNPAVEVTAVAALDRATPGQVSFLANPRYRRFLKASHASAIIVGAGGEEEGVCCLVVPDPYLAFARAVEILHPAWRPAPGIDGRAVVHATATLGDDVCAMAGVYVGEGARVGDRTVLYPGVYVGRNARIGRECLLYPNAVVGEECVVGDRVILQPGVVIGGDGFGFAKEGHRWVKIPQVGNVVIEDDVEMGAGSAVDRAALGETRVGRGTKIDNQVHIGHGTRVGEDCMLIGQLGLAGSVTVGNRVTLAARVAVVGHVRIGDDATVGMMSFVTTDVPPGAYFSGYPARDHRSTLRGQALTRKLPEMKKQIQALEERISQLEDLLRRTVRDTLAEDER